MSKIDMRIENYDTVYSALEDYEQPQRFVKSAYWVIDKAMKPDIYLQPGVEQELDRFRADGTRQFFVFNHLLTTPDPFVAAAIAHRIVPEDVGHTRVIAKDELFNKPYPQWFIKAMGGLPAYRGKNYSDKVPGWLLHRSAVRLAQTTNNLLAYGNNIASYQEGTNNKGERDVHTIGPIKPGIWHMTHDAVNSGVPVVLTPVGSSYGWTQDTLNPRDAISVVGNSLPITDDLSIDDLVAMTSESLQAAVTDAALIRHNAAV